MIVPVGVCSTFFTLPLLPCPSSWRSLRSSLCKSWNFVSELMSRLAIVVDNLVWYVIRCADAVPVVGAELGPGKVSTVSSASGTVPFALTFGALSSMGGGFFFLPAPGAGARRVGAGSSGDVGVGWATLSCRALKFRFLRMGVAAGEAGEGVAMPQKRQAHSRVSGTSAWYWYQYEYRRTKVSRTTCAAARLYRLQRPFNASP